MKKTVLVLFFVMLVLLTACSPAKTARDAVKTSEPRASAEEPSKTDSTTADTTKAPLEETKPSVSVIEPDALLSIEQASSITGVAYNKTEKKEQEVVGQKLVVYNTAEGDGYFQIALTQQAFMPAKQSSTPEKLYRDITAAFPDAKKIDGLGEEARLAGPLLHVLEKGYYLTFASDCEQDKRIEAAKAAVEKLDSLIK